MICTRADNYSNQMNFQCYATFCRAYGVWCLTSLFSVSVLSLYLNMFFWLLQFRHWYIQGEATWVLFWSTFTSTYVGNTTWFSIKSKDTIRILNWKSANVSARQNKLINVLITWTCLTQMSTILLQPDWLSTLFDIPTSVNSLLHLAHCFDLLLAKCASDHVIQLWIFLEQPTCDTATHFLNTTYNFSSTLH
jgi:hypothetical protein